MTVGFAVMLTALMMARAPPGMRRNGMGRLP